jgi:hypothetical protein
MVKAHDFISFYKVFQRFLKSSKGFTKIQSKGVKFVDYMVMYFWEMVFAWLPWFVMIFGLSKVVNNKKTKELESNNLQLTQKNQTLIKMINNYMKKHPGADFNDSKM